MTSRLRNSLLLVAVAVASLGGIALAMHIRSNDSVVAWLAEGRGVLIAREQQGPEGGGSLSYQALVPGEHVQQEWMLQSNFNPGNGSRPEQVSEATYQARVRELRALLEKYPSPEITVSPNKRRSATIVRSGAPIAAACSFASLETIKATVVVTEGRLSCSKPRNDAHSLLGYLSPSRSILVVVRTTDVLESQLVGVFFAEGGELKRFAK